MFVKITKLIAYLLTVALCLMLAFFAAIFLQTYREYQAFRNRELQYEQRLKQLRREVEIKEEYLRLVVTEPDFLERVVRRKLGYARPDETIFRFEQKTVR